MQSRIKSQMRSASNRQNRFSPKASRQKLCLLAAVAGVSAIAPFAHGQTPYIDITAKDYNPATGVITPDIAPANVILQAGVMTSVTNYTYTTTPRPTQPTIATGATVNGTSAIQFSGSNFFQFQTSIGGIVSQDTIPGQNITIVAYLEPAASSLSNPATIVGGARGSIQYRLNSGNNDQQLLNGGVAGLGNTNTAVSGTSFSAVGINIGSSSTFFLNGASNGTASAPSGGFDQFGGKDNTQTGGTAAEPGSQEEFNGKIVELQIYNSVLTSAQIIAVQNQMISSYTLFPLIYYTGAVNGNWDTTTSNFQTASGTVTQFSNTTPSTAVFGDTAFGNAVANPNISIQSAGVSPHGVIFNNSVLNYTLSNSGSNGISGSGGITKNGSTGNLTFNGSNTFTGPVILNGGNVYLNANAALDSASSIAVSGSSLTVNPSVTLNNAGTFTLPSGALIVQSSGTATLSGSTAITLGNTATGNIINNGSLSITAPVSVGSSVYSEMTLYPGSTTTISGVLSAAYGSFTGGKGTVNVLGGKLTTISPLAGITVAGYAQTGVLNVTNGGTIVASTVQGTNSGVVNFNGGTLQANAATPSLLSGLTSAFIYSGGATFNDSGNVVIVPQSLVAPTGTGLTSVAFSAPGTGYSYIPTVQVFGGTLAAGGAPATATAIYNPVTQQVTGVNITNPGNYIQSSTGSITFGFTSNTGTPPSVSAITTSTNAGGGLTKIGGGTLVLSGSNTYTGPTNITAGKLQVSAPSVVTVPNGSFNTPYVTAYNFNNYATASWTFSGNSGMTNGTTSTTGYQEYGESPVNTTYTNGVQYAYLQTNSGGTGEIQQNLNLSAGTYTLNFYATQRYNTPVNDENFNVSIGGITLTPSGGFYPGATWAEQSYSFTVGGTGSVPVGIDALTFQALNPTGAPSNDNSALLNDVSLVQVSGATNAYSIPSTSQVTVAGGATFDVNNSVQTVGSLNGSGSVTLGSAGTAVLSVGGDNTLSSNFSGTISGIGGLNKVGAGIQTLSGINTFTGPTMISGGVLALGPGSVLTISPVTVQSGGALGTNLATGQTASFGNSSTNTLVTVLPGGGINLSDGAISTLAILGTPSSTPLILGATNSSTPTLLTFDIGNAATGTDLIAVTGFVSALSTVDIVINPLASDSNISSGKYTLITAAGGLATSNYTLGAKSTIQVGSVGYALSLSQSTSGVEYLSVVQTGGVLANAYWTGGLSTAWNDSSGVLTNWASDVNGGTNNGLLPSSVTNVFFTVTSGGTNLATTLSSPESVNSVTFNGNAAGPVSITGSTLSIVGAAINGNAAGNGINLSSGSSAVTFNSNVNAVNSQTWTNNSPNALTMNGSIGGIGTITQAGSGLIVLAGSNSFTGGYIVNGGTLDLNSRSALGTGAFTVNSATTLDNTSGAPVSLGVNNTQAWNSDFTFTGSSNLNMGTGTVTISANRTLTLLGGSLLVGGISDGGAGFSLTTIGSGTLAIGGTSTYTGATNVGASSTLSFVGAGADASGAVINVNPGASVVFNSTGTSTFSDFNLGGSTGTSVMNIASGTVNVLGMVAGGDSFNGFLMGTQYNANSNTILNVTGGTLNVGPNGYFQAGFGGNSTINMYNGSINVTTGGNDLLLGVFATTVGNTTTFNMSGGSVTDSGNTVVGYRSAAIINLSGTAQFTTNAVRLGATGNGYATLNLNGGTITTSNVSTAGNGGTINFSGGTLQAASNTTTLIDASSTLTVNVLSGGAIFDSHGYTATVLQPLTTPVTMPATIGNVTKIGTGTIILGGSNSYTGKTTISKGTLQMPGAPVSVGDNNFSQYQLYGSPYFTYGPSNPYWNFGGQSGIVTQTPATFTASGFALYNPVPSGSQAGFIENNGSISQTLNLPANGTYTLSYYTEQRETTASTSNQNTNGQNGGSTDETLQVSLSSGPSTVPSSAVVDPTTNWEQVSYVFSAAAGNYTFTWQGSPLGTDSTAYINNIILSGGAQGSTSYGVPSASPVVVATAGVFDVNGNTQAIGSLAGSGLVTMEGGTLVTGNDGSNTTFNGSIGIIGVETGSVTKVGIGTQTLSGSNYYTGGTVVNGGTLVFASNASCPALTPLTVNSPGIAMVATHNGASGRLVLQLSSLSLSGNTGGWTGTLDLTNNDLIVHTGSPTQTLATITNQVGFGYAGGTWQGSGGGIISSTAAADTSHLTALGVILNDNPLLNNGTALLTSLDGAPTVDGDVLVKYTYYGDADLSGTVDGSDYTLIDNSYLAENFQNGVPASLVSGWYNGDFNYDGVVDGSDYTLMDNAFNLTNDATISTQIATTAAQVGGSSVPEPASLSLMAFGAVGLLGRRRRSR